MRRFRLRRSLSRSILAVLCDSGRAGTNEGPLMIACCCCGVRMKPVSLIMSELKWAIECLIRVWNRRCRLLIVFLHLGRPWLVGRREGPVLPAMRGIPSVCWVVTSRSALADLVNSFAVARLLSGRRGPLWGAASGGRAWCPGTGLLSGSGA